MAGMCIFVSGGRWRAGGRSLKGGYWIRWSLTSSTMRLVVGLSFNKGLGGTSDVRLRDNYDK